MRVSLELCSGQKDGRTHQQAEAGRHKHVDFTRAETKWSEMFSDSKGSNSSPGLPFPLVCCSVVEATPDASRCRLLLYSVVRVRTNQTAMVSLFLSDIYSCFQCLKCTFLTLLHVKLEPYTCLSFLISFKKQENVFYSFRTCNIQILENKINTFTLDEFLSANSALIKTKYEQSQ